MAPAGMRTFRHQDFPIDVLLEAKRGRHISVSLPARNEEATIGAIVSTIRSQLVERHPLVDEVLVIDDGSTDATAGVATTAGAVVVAAADVLPGCGPGAGKGEALWKSLHASKGDVIVFCDADVRDFDPSFITGLAGPLLLHDDVSFTKGFYRRPLDGVPGQGGRVTELVARPLISLFFPALVPVVQPLAGEYAGRRELLEQLPFVRGYGVDVALLIDVAARFGLDCIAQVDLGDRVHRNRPLDELAPQAMAIVRTVLERAGMAIDSAEPSVFARPGHAAVVVDTGERPPIIEVDGYCPRR